MSLILNELEWAEKRIQEKDLGKKPFETLARVAKYYYAQHYSKDEIRDLLDAFVLQCDPHASLVRWSDMLDRIVKNINKYRVIAIDGVSLSPTELAVIDGLEKSQLQRLAFTLLCVAKYWDAVSPSNNHWVNSSDIEIMQMANMKPTLKRQSELFGILRDAGLIRFSKKVDNLNVQVLFADEGETALYIQDFRNLGYQYLRHHGGPFYECANCGVVTKLPPQHTGRPPKYCSACSAEVRIRQNIDSVMRHRKTPAT